MVITPATLLWALAVPACLVLMSLSVSGPVLSDPTRRALGAPLGEAAAHLWGLLVAADGLWVDGPFVRVSDAAWPAGFRGDLVDPLHLAVIAPLAAVGGRPGGVLGWNLLPVVSLCLAAAGGGWMGARLGLGRSGQALMACLLVCSPSFAGATVPVGRSEQLVLGWASLHLAALHAALHEGGNRRVLVAGATLGLQALGGWRPLMLLMFLELPLVLAWSWRPGAWRRALGVGAIGGAIVCPMLLAHRGVEPWWWTVETWPSPFEHEVSASLPSSLWTVRGSREWMGDPTANAGRVALVGALLGAVRRPRTAAAWALLGLGLWALALGLRVTVGEDVIHGPAAWLSWVVPPLRAVHGWPRLAPLALIPLAIASARGLAGVRHAPWWTAVLIASALAEGLTWRPVGDGFIDARPPAALEALDAGALVSLPLRPEPGPASQASADRMLLWAHGLQRPTSVAPSPWPDSVAPLLGPLRDVGRPSPPRACDPGLAVALRRAGVGAVLLHTDQLPHPAVQREAVREVTTQLGPPVANGPGWFAFGLSQPTGCTR